ncbi:MAG TPA: hypothetical protein VNG32_02960 [Candidatus Dormibacteraeota bacterium]|nr:hypothetical protein [Candidatus Dormibacteraeota bacterium]
MLSPTNSNAQKHNYHVGLTLLIALWLVVVGLLVVNGQSIVDWWRLRGYVPPAAVVNLANEDTMTAYTRHLFYLNRPQLLSSVTSFRGYCPENLGSIVLGCYHPDQDGIFIYNVSDPSLAGVQQVTAAHEVLHAVYARLTSSERANLNSELQSYYDNGLTNTQVKAEVKLYQQTEPGSVMDEMSCTFGTEIANLPAALNAYYSKYFTNRAAIVAHEQNYQAAFSSRQAVVAQDDAQLASLKSQLDSTEAQLTTSLNSLNAQQSNLNSLRNSGNIAAYDAGVPAYNSLVNAYNAQVQVAENLVAQYNQQVAARNQVAGQITTLVTALDTRIAHRQQATR